MSPKKKLFNISSLVIGGVLLIAVSSAYGIYYGSRLGELTERSFSSEDSGRLLEQLHDPSPRERELGLLALKNWSKSGQNQYLCAYDMVRGKTLIGLNGVQISYALGRTTKSMNDKGHFRLKYAAPGRERSFSELYVTFTKVSEGDPTVTYAGIYVCDY